MAREPDTAAETPLDLPAAPHRPLSKRALATRNALLDAARQVFAARGFEGATISEIVARSGTSVGSLYNQFGGKEHLFLELHRRHSELLWEATQQAMERARATGERDPFRLYLAGARAYLLACWDERDLARLFLSGEGPPGFDAIARGALRRWINQNADVLQVTGRRFGEALAAAVTGVVAAGARQVVACPARDDAAEMTEYFAMLVTRLAQPADQPGTHYLKRDFNL
ncbi:TetR/AcrR family transcriptional regulator [Nonomuraea zeae]|uniref:TetR/AcrR family transcriptional regulator n=1 Tax=Nonomuraea zeae TaxID=1642303 RepID=A0A5S4G5Y6_9ACTN|nr:TetR/AcrR family transcriptional regulator [Nonomuraea zeae]TMR28426.1 TetR/AcrR family transcriptional regulator [Nonomuraea zeae]